MAGENNLTWPSFLTPYIFILYCLDEDMDDVFQMWGYS